MAARLMHSFVASRIYLLWVFENRVPRRIFEPEGVKVTRGCRKFHEGRYNFYSSPNMIRVIRSRRMGRVGHVARIT
jgi:hypothetical protein